MTNYFQNKKFLMYIIKISECKCINVLVISLFHCKGKKLSIKII